MKCVCPNCNHTLEITSQMIGGKIKCSNCSSRFTIQENEVGETRKLTKKPQKLPKAEVRDGYLMMHLSILQSLLLAIILPGAVASLILFVNVLRATDDWMLILWSGLQFIYVLLFGCFVLFSLFLIGDFGKLVAENERSSRITNQLLLELVNRDQESSS